MLLFWELLNKLKIQSKLSTSFNIFNKHFLLFDKRLSVVQKYRSVLHAVQYIKGKLANVWVQ